MDDFRSGGMEYSVTLKTLIEEFKLETLYIPEGRKIKITQPEVNRPGLALSGFFEFFDHNRIQLIGNAEHQYIAALSKSDVPLPLENKHFTAAIAALKSPPMPCSSPLTLCSATTVVIGKRKKQAINATRAIKQSTIMIFVRVKGHFVKKR